MERREHALAGEAPGGGHVALRVLVGVQLLAVLVLATTAALRHHVFGEIDERAHYDFIQKVVEDGRLPRPTDPVSRETKAIGDNTWPRPSFRRDPDPGLRERSYEAMQPPLYYLAAAPVFAAVPDHRDKVIAVRLFNVALLGLSVWLLWLLALRLAPMGAALPAFAIVLAVVLWPGVIVRSTSIGNTPLETPMALAFLLVLWEAHRSRRWRWFAAAGAILGLCLLTKVALQYLVPLYLAVLALRLRRDRSWRSARRAAALALLPALMLTPWLAVNVARYDAPLVDMAGRPQVFTLERAEEGRPTGTVAAPAGAPPAPDLRARIELLGDYNFRLLNGLLPQEWDWHMQVVAIRALTRGFVIAVLVLALGLALLAPNRRLLWFLMLPAITGVAIMNAVFLLTGDDAFYLRYLYPALLPLALGVGLGAHAMLARSRAGRRRSAIGVLGGTAALSSLAMCALFAYLAGSHYFKDVGGALGIPPGY